MRRVVREMGTARGLALIALVIVLIASIVNNVATAVQSQDNCQDIQKIDRRLVNVFQDTRKELTSGSRDGDLQHLYGYRPVKVGDGKTIPRWRYLKQVGIKQYTDLINQFKEEKCPLPLLGIRHRD